MKRTLSLCIFLSGVATFAAEPQTKDEVRAQMAQAQQRESESKSQIAMLESEIAALRTQVSDAKILSAALNQKIYTKLGITPSDAEAFLQGVSAFTVQVNGYQAQYGPDLKGWETAVVWSEYQVKQLQLNPAARLERADTSMARAKGAVQGSRTALESVKAQDVQLQEQQKQAQVLQAQQAADQATKAEQARIENEKRTAEDAARLEQERKAEQLRIAAERSDRETGKIPATYVTGRYRFHKDGSLWQISGIVYGDHSKWQRLWRANHGMIKDPDRIVPGMTLVVPPGPVPKPAD